VDHILTKQVFGIGITELTSFLARRSLYCSKNAKGIHSVARSFPTEDGGIWFERIEHSWIGQRCQYCGTSRSEYERSIDFETHAYAFIHTENINVEINKMFGENMRFLSMVIPARWFSGGKGLDDFRAEMLSDSRLRRIEDFPDSSDVFPGVQIKGGVCYFLWSKDTKGDVQISTHDKGQIVSVATRPLLETGADVFIRYNEAVPILKKVMEVESGKKNAPLSLPEGRSFSDLVSVRRPFNLDSTFKARAKKQAGDIDIYRAGGIDYAKKSEVEDPNNLVNKWKVFIPFLASGSDSFPHSILSTPFIGSPGTACTETYLTIGPFKSKQECKNAISYISTRLFRFIVLQKKPSQNATRKVYEFIPMQDFSEEWNDEKLFMKYKISNDEIAFIESMVRPMEVLSE
jgi:hypothetical protein